MDCSCAESCAFRFSCGGCGWRETSWKNNAGAGFMSRAEAQVVVQNHLISFRVSSCDWWFKSLLRL